MTYNGGKGASGVYQQIINKMPKHKTYIETHLGGGTILVKKKKSMSTIAIEIDTAVMKKFKEYSTIINEDEISFYEDDCIKVLKKLNLNHEVLIYADPPYLFETRKNKKKLYKHEYNKKNHFELLNYLNSLDCFIMISGYQSNLYDQILTSDKWFKFTFNSMTRQGIAKEVLWCNFNPDDYIKHDYSYIGANFRERELLKKKAKRWIKNLNKMKDDERNYLLSNITDNFNLELSNHF